MKPLKYLVILNYLLLFLSHAARAEDAAESKQRMNILFLFTDDQRWDTIGALGNSEVKTPVIDKLVETGFTFTNAYCQGSWSGAVCLPSRTMVMMGQSVWRIRKKETRTLLPQAFTNAGYITFRSGKGGNTCRAANKLFDFNTNSGDNRHSNSSQEHADRAIRFLQEHKGDKPFYMHLAFDKPHDPRRAPPNYMKMYDPEKISLPPNFLPRHPFDNGELYVRDENLAPFPRTPEVMRKHIADYYACCSDLDNQIGRILETVKKRGFADNTMVIFSSDHGLAVGGQHGLMGKQNLYECNKPPLIISGPGIPKGKSDAFVYLYDLYPTFCEMAGIEIPASVEGKSILPVIRGKQEKIRDYVYGAYKNSQRMVRDGRWKLMKYNAGGKKNVQLFDLETDPHEIENLAEEPAAAEHRTRLEALLVKAMKEFGDPVDFERAGGPASAKNTRRKRGRPGKPGKPIRPRKDGSFVLKPEFAKTTGSLRYQSDRQNLGAWNRAEDSAAFTLEGIRTGKYLVLFSYGTSRGGQGYVIEAGPARITEKTEATGGMKNYKEYEIGMLDLSGAKATLTIRPVGKLQSALMNYRIMKLVPVP